MKERNGRKSPNHLPQDPVQSPRLIARALGAFLAMVVISAAGLLFCSGKSTGAKAPAPSEPVSTTEGKLNYDRLKGRWQRPNGGYVIDINEVDADGKMAAAYFNPRPVNVSRAEATLDGNTLKVFIELRDINYPGATYHLTYDPGSDQLHGIYFQPALQRSFQVFFVRMK